QGSEIDRRLQGGTGDGPQDRAAGPSVATFQKRRDFPVRIEAKSVGNLAKTPPYDVCRGWADRFGKFLGDCSEAGLGIGSPDKADGPCRRVGRFSGATLSAPF